MSYVNFNDPNETGIDDKGNFKKIPSPNKLFKIANNDLTKICVLASTITLKDYVIDKIKECNKKNKIKIDESFFNSVSFIKWFDKLQISFNESKDKMQLLVELDEKCLIISKQIKCRKKNKED